MIHQTLTMICPQAGAYLSKAKELAFSVGSSGEKLSLSRILLEPQDSAYDVNFGKKLAINLASAGNVSAMTMLSEKYEAGAFGKVDLPQSLYWLQKASAYGSVGAKLHLSRFYREGLAVDKDVKQADLLMSEALEAAEGGSDVSLAQMGRAFKKGDGVSKDKEEAFDWFIQAANGGHMGAKMRLLGL